MGTHLASELDRRRGANATMGQQIRRAVRLAVTLWLVGLAIAGAVVWYVRSDPARSRGDSFSDPNGAIDRPTLRPAGGGRILEEVPVASTAGGFELLGTWRADPDRPITYDPCHPIEVVVNPNLAPPGFAAVVDQTLATASAASGLAFRVESLAADESPSAARAAFQPERYGDRWSPVLIAWSTPDQFPELAGPVAGMGGSTWVESDRRGAWNVSGAVTLDAPQLGDDPVAAGAVLLHEIGHVLGLAHTADADQLMHQNGTQVTLNDGDRAGFATVGAGDCAPPL